MCEVCYHGVIKLLATFVSFHREISHLCTSSGLALLRFIVGSVAMLPVTVLSAAKDGTRIVDMVLNGTNPNRLSMYVGETACPKNTRLR